MLMLLTGTSRIVSDFVKLPNWAPSLRPLQTTAIEDILEAFNSTPVVFYEAPTGAGKTLIGEVVRQELNARGIYLCSSLSLQDQFTRDFPQAAVIKGRSNYPTLNHPDRFSTTHPFNQLSAADCNKRKSGTEWQCAWCDPVSLCPYEEAKATAMRSDQVCANSYYYLYECNYVGSLRHRDLVVVDEVDTLESVLMSFIEVSITEHRVREFGLPYPGRKTVLSSWVEWAEECQEIVHKIRTDEQVSMFDSVDLKRLRYKKRLDVLRGDLARLLDKDFGLESENWIYDGYRENNVVFKPVTVAPYADKYLWRHGYKWLMMSATIISELELANSLGLSG